MTTPVIFRKWKKSSDQWESIIAVFPTDLAGPNDWICNSYEHIGQHGGCNYQGVVLPRTVPATPDEYADLLAELIKIGYTDLKIYKRWQYRFNRELARQWEETYGQHSHS